MTDSYIIEKWTLPAPAFPFVAQETTDPLWALVRKTQADMIETVRLERANYVFLVKDGVSPQPFVGEEKDRTLQMVRALCHFAMLFRTPITVKTIARGHGLIPAWTVRAIAPFLHMAVTPEAFRKFILETGKTDRISCARWIASEVDDWIDLEGVCGFVGGVQSEFFGPYEEVLKEFTDNWPIDFL